MSHPTVSAYYLGACETSSLTYSKTSSRSIEEKIIEQLENAQLSGKIPRTTNDPDKEIIIEMSKFGLKLINRKTGDVTMRIPLLNLVLFTTFNDGYGKIDGVILENCETTQKRYKSHLIQFQAETSANLLCKLVNESFMEAEEAKAIVTLPEPPSPSLVDY